MQGIRRRRPSGKKKYTVTVLCAGGANAYVTINGTKVTEAGTYEVSPGDTIILSAGSTLAVGQIFADKKQVASGNSQVFSCTYSYTITERNTLVSLHPGGLIAISNIMVYGRSSLDPVTITVSKTSSTGYVTVDGEKLSAGTYELPVGTEIICTATGSGTSSGSINGEVQLNGTKIAASSSLSKTVTFSYHVAVDATISGESRVVKITEA